MSENKYCLPWRIANTKNKYDEDVRELQMCNGLTIAELEGDYGIEEHVAEFILRAVNSHYPLIDIAKGVVKPFPTGLEEAELTIAAMNILTEEKKCLSS